MKYFHTRVLQLKELMDSYAWPMPFAGHLKQYFSKHKNLGGKDRKAIRALAYSFFRISKALSAKSFEENTKTAAAFLENEESITHFIENTEGFDAGSVFPFHDYVSDPFKNEIFQASFLAQPNVWIKVQKSHINEVKDELESQNIAYSLFSEQIFFFQSDEKLSELESYKKGLFRIQDLSSQQTADSFLPGAGETWWDCCAGSGGKSLGLLDAENDISLYASDIRESILNNLELRLAMGYPGKKLNIFAADITQPIDLKLPEFDGIILDAPCSGSGTWARNPENLYYFKPTAIKDYAARQLDILENIYPYIKPGKPLIYITCSVFKEENEAVIEKFSSHHPVKIEEQKYFEGYRHGAENMFLCRMIK